MTTENFLISETVHIDAPAAKVWEIISDITQMGERSDQCKKMIILGKDKTVKV